MSSLDLLETALQNTTTSKPTDENTSQSYFDKVVGYIEEEKLSDAVSMIEKVFAQGTLDIRLIAYYFYAKFADGGIKSFIEIFPRLSEILNDHWEALRPINRKDKQVQNSLNWLILQIVDKLKFSEKQFKSGKKQPIWIKSTIEITPQEIDETLAKLAQFKEFFSEKWPQSSTNERLLHLVKLIEDLKDFVHQKAAKVVDEPEPQASEEKIAPTIEEKMEVPIEVLRQENIVIPEKSTEIYESILCEKKEKKEGLSCENLHLIADKLRVFELLIQKNDTVKAALVAKDIELLIQNFDPLIYFPKLFSNYFSLVARNIAALAEQWQNTESLQQKYLEKLYKTDLDQFIEW